MPTKHRPFALVLATVQVIVGALGTLSMLAGVVSGQGPLAFRLIVGALGLGFFALCVIGGLGVFMRKRWGITASAWAWGIQIPRLFSPFVALSALAGPEFTVGLTHGWSQPGFEWNLRMFASANFSAGLFPPVPGWFIGANLLALGAAIYFVALARCRTQADDPAELAHEIAV